MSFRTPPTPPRTFVTPPVVALALCLLAAPLLAPRPALGQAPAGQTQSQTQAGPISLRGTVADPDDAVIPGASITLAPASGKVITATSQSDGTYTVRSVPTGTYTITFTMPGFAAFVRQGVKITAGTPLTLNAKLVIQDAEQVVNVTTTQNTVSVDQDSNASATVLKGKDLEALSDDPDELASELSALAGPAAGPNGGQIYIDGFTGGQLPPKSSIREIRINQNPFSAQFDRAGFGRVEVFTKPGTDKLHGSANIQGQDKSFNTGSPFIPATTFQPGYHTVFGQGSVTGPLNSRASFTTSGSFRQIEDNTVVNPPAIFATSQTSGTICLPGTAGCSIYSTVNGNGFTFAQSIPQRRWDISQRFDYGLTEKNTITTRIQYEHNSSQNNNVGGNDIASTAANSTSAEFEIQASDTQIVSAKVINETRFEFQRSPSSTVPFSTAQTISVAGAFVGGGSNGGTSNDTQYHIEAQNYTSVALTKHFLRLGGRLRTTSDSSTTTAGANGTFTYNSIYDYTGLPVGCVTAGPGCVAGAPKLSQFSINKINTPTVSARSTDLGLYAEDDWKVRPNLTFSYGLRFETQNFIHDKADFAPRLSLAYALGKKTVVRAGAGVFYDRFSLGHELNVYRNNGLNEVATLLSATATTPIDPACGPSTPANCSGSVVGHTSIRSINGSLRAPYTIQANVGVDQQLFRGATLSVNYQHIRGLHQFNSGLTNYSTLTATSPLLFEYQSAGVFNQNQLVTNVNYRAGRASLFGYYVVNFANSDTSGSSSLSTVPYNLKADYGRASFDTRQRTFIGSSINLPYLITLSPLLVASSGSPYNITAGVDVNGDTVLNDRAVAVPVGTTPIAGGYVKTIPGCGTFATPGTLGNFTPVPINDCTGPASLTFNLRATKTFGFGASTHAGAQDAGPQEQHGPGGHGGRGGYRGGMDRGGGGASSGRRYNLSFGAQVLNLFNVVDRNVPVGALPSPSFGLSTQLAGNIFTTQSAVRRIYLQAAFNF